MKDLKINSAPLCRWCMVSAEGSTVSYWLRKGAALGHVPEGGQREPQQEDEFESVVEGEPVDDGDEALNDSEAGKDDPVLR